MREDYTLLNKHLWDFFKLVLILWLLNGEIYKFMSPSSRKNCLNWDSKTQHIMSRLLRLFRKNISCAVRRMIHRKWRKGCGNLLVKPEKKSRSKKRNCSSTISTSSVCLIDTLNVTVLCFDIFLHLLMDLI